MAGELAAAKKAAAAAGKALKEDETTKAQLARMAEDMPAMHGAAESYARKVAIRQAASLKLIWEPLRKILRLQADYFDTNFSEDMAERLADVPEEDLVTPAPNVAAPALQGLGYSFDQDSLKDMYLNLLATATDARTRGDAHPSFPDVIRQLDADEATALTMLFKAGAEPIANIHVQMEGSSGFTIAHRNLLDLRDSDTGERKPDPLFATWIDNWQRLGLIDVNYMNTFSDETRYEWLDARPEVIALREQGAVVDYGRGVLSITDYGERFANAVGAHAEADEYIQQMRVRGKRIDG